jgi:HSP20 family protein
MSLFFNTPSLFNDPLLDSSLVWTPFTRRSRVNDSTQQFIQQKRQEFDKLSNEFWSKAEQELKQKQEEERKQRQLQLTESKSGGKDSKALTNTGNSGNNNSDTQLANRSSTNDLLSSFWNDVEQGGMNIDLKDNDQCYTVTASIPGFDKDQLNLEYNDGLLTISGDQSTEEKSSDGSSYSKSSKYVSRSIRLSDPIDRGSVSAKYDNGQLRIELPKLPKKTEEKSKDESIKIK